MTMKFVYISLILFFVSSCVSQNLQLELSESNNDSLEQTDVNCDTSWGEQTVLGDTIEIPYTISNLLKALESLPIETKSQINPKDIYPTHYYVRFHPKNANELALLEEITPRLMLSETPLDREILVRGSSYHDPSLPVDMPTYQYTTIDAEYWKSLSDTLSVEGDVLLEAFMPDYIIEEQTKSYPTSIIGSTYEELLCKAYEMTGCTYIPRTKSSKWNPSGVIKAYDTKANKYVPIKGVRVRGTHLLTIKETLTDGTGYYCLDAFTSPVNMKVVWEGESWDVRDGNLSQAVYEGSKVENLQWNLLINSTETKQLAFSALHRAAYRYYCDFIFNISRPDNSRREKLAYIDGEIKDGESNGDFNQQLGLGIWSDIRIPGMNTDGRRENAELFSSTCHELGHLSHYTNAKQNFKNSERRVNESWACFTQYLLTKREYSELGINYLIGKVSQNGVTGDTPDIFYNNQSSIDDIYTPLLIDLYDSFNQYLYFNNNAASDDRISNISPSVVEEIVFNSRSFTEIRDKLADYISKYSGPMYNLNQNNINLLFINYL